MERPLLWHIPISHFSEKVRWALDWKQVPHRRRVATPGLHPLVAFCLTRGAGYTAPLLEIDGEVIGDSTAIIAELERRWPTPALYPANPDERRRALEIEDWFDEHVGAPARAWAFHGLTSDPEALVEVAGKQMENWPGPTPSFGGAIVKQFVGARYGVSEERARTSEGAIEAGFDRLEEELARGGGEHLVGRTFTVADLTAAALLYPLVLPVGAPWLPQRRPEPVERFRAALRDRPGWRWVEETWRRHRRHRRPVTTV